MMNKPLNYVCSTVSDSHKTVYSLIPDKIKNSLNGAVLHTIGRLDADSTGLLLFTTNGRLSNYFTNPAYHVEKTYLVGLKNAASTEEQFLYKNAFSTGITLPEYKHGSAFTTKPAEIQFTDEKNCIILISEGKFRQIRRMIYALGNEVTALKRIKMGGIAMPDDLSEGEFVEIGRESFAECV